MFYFRESIRPIYRDIVQLRSKFSCPTLCLTATATQDIVDDIVGHLHFRDFKIVARLPDRPNIFLEVRHRNSYNYEIELKEIVDGLKEKGLDYPKTLVFAKSTLKVIDLCEFFVEQLGESALVSNHCSSSTNELSIDESGVEQPYIVSMYHAEVGENLHRYVLSEFRKPDSKIRVLGTTIAYGMGMDVKDIRNIIHWGCQSSVQSHWQEVGRAGRDGEAALAIWYPKGSGGKQQAKVDKEVFDKIKNDREVCVRKTFLEHFVLSSMEDNVLDYLSRRELCDKGCDSCLCSYCVCCNHCKSLCPCSSV